MAAIGSHRRRRINLFLSHQEWAHATSCLQERGMDARLRRRYHLVAFRLAEGAGKLVSKRTKRRFRAQPQSSPVTRTSKHILIRLPPLLGTRYSVFFFRHHFCWNQNNRPVVFNRLGSYNHYSHRPAQTLSNAYEPCHVSNWNSPFSSENAITNARPGHPCMIHVCTCKPSLLYSSGVLRLRLCSNPLPKYQAGERDIYSEIARLHLLRWYARKRNVTRARYQNKTTCARAN
jgi:hypothetical protein